MAPRMHPHGSRSRHAPPRRSDRPMCTQSFVRGLVPLAFYGALAAQGVVVPALPGVDAPARAEFAGVTHAQRQQVLVAGRHLLGLRGTPLRALVVRRDPGAAGSLRGGAVELEVALSTSPADPDAPAEAFAANQGPDRRVVFQGVVNVPDAPAPGASVDPWGAASTVRVDFATPFPYAGGTLCLDLSGRPLAGSASPYWPVDAWFTPGDGRVEPIGAGCARLQHDGGDAGGWASTLRPGASAVFEAFAQPGASGFLLLGAQALPGGLDLGAVGMAGCRLWVDPVLVLGATFAPLPQPFAVAQASVAVLVPKDPILLGAVLHAQWLEVELALPPRQWSTPAGFALSGAVRATLASQATTAGMAMVVADWQPPAPPPALGLVQPALAPVLWFP